MRRARIPLIAALFAMAAVAGASGCTHYHYYGAQPAVIGAPSQVICEPQVSRQVSVVPYGSVCEVPAASDGLLAGAPPRRGDIIVSRPQGASSGRRTRGSGLAWRRPDPEGLATTRVEGGLDESAVR